MGNNLGNRIKITFADGEEFEEFHDTYKNYDKAIIEADKGKRFNTMA